MVSTLQANVAVTKRMKTPTDPIVFRAMTWAA
jgi:hypothetical protein